MATGALYYSDGGGKITGTVQVLYIGDVRGDGVMTPAEVADEIDVAEDVLAEQAGWYAADGEFLGLDFEPPQ